MAFNVFKLTVNEGTKKFEFLDRISPISVVWQECENDIGRVQAVFVADEHSRELIKEGRYCSLTPAKGANFARISGVDDSGGELVAYAEEAKEVFRRVGKFNSGKNGAVDVQTVIPKAIANSGLSFIDTDVIVPYDGTVNLDTMSYSTIYDYIQLINAIKGAGWHCKLEENLGIMSVSIDKGKDKSDYIQFAPIFGNAYDYKYTVDGTHYRNKIIVVGADGDTPVFEEATNALSWHEIYSAYVDVRSEFPRPKDMTLADYRAALRQRAEDELTRHRTIESLIIPDVEAKGFGEDYGLGDIVSVVLPELGMVKKCRVIAFKRTVEGGMDRTTIDLKYFEDIGGSKE